MKTSLALPISVEPDDTIAKQVQRNNEETSKREVEQWLANPPDKYFAYVKVTRYGDSNIAGTSNYPRGDITTWMGDKLGYFVGGLPYRSAFGDKSISIDVYGTNGIAYYGTYYCSFGDYCRLYRRKDNAANREHYKRARAYKAKLESESKEQ